MKNPKVLNFKVGDQVEFGGATGLVSTVNYADPYPITVLFLEEAAETFTTEGKYYSWHPKPLLFLVNLAKKTQSKKRK